MRLRLPMVQAYCSLGHSWTPRALPFTEIIRSDRQQPLLSSILRPMKKSLTRKSQSASVAEEAVRWVHRIPPWGLPGSALEIRGVGLNEMWQRKTLKKELITENDTDFMSTVIDVSPFQAKKSSPFNSPLRNTEASSASFSPGKLRGKEACVGWLMADLPRSLTSRRTTAFCGIVVALWWPPRRLRSLGWLSAPSKAASGVLTGKSHEAWKMLPTCEIHVSPLRISACPPVAHITLRGSRTSASWTVTMVTGGATFRVQF